MNHKSKKNPYIELELEFTPAVRKDPYNKGEELGFDFSLPNDLASTLAPIRRQLSLADLDPHSSNRPPKDWTPLWQQVVLDDRLEAKVMVDQLLVLFELSRDQLPASVVLNLIELLFRNKRLADQSAGDGILSSSEDLGGDGISRSEDLRGDGFPRHGLSYLNYLSVSGGIRAAIIELAQMGQSLESTTEREMNFFKDVENSFKQYLSSENDRLPQIEDFPDTKESYNACKKAQADFRRRREEERMNFNAIANSSRKSVDEWLRNMEKPTKK